jgi:cell division topological specificity factor
MIEFFRKLFGQPGSSSTAKERLRLVLMSDHITLAPDMIDRLKADLIEVISRYVEVDRDKIDVTFEEQDKALAMLANIPILSVNRPSGGATVSPGEGPKPPAHLPRRRRRKKAQTGSSGATATATPAPAT